MNWLKKNWELIIFGCLVIMLFGALIFRSNSNDNFEGATITENRDNEAYLKNTVDPKIDTIDGFFDVPSQNSSANATMRDVIGNKTDTETGNSIYSILDGLNKHFHSISHVYPSLAAGITVTCGSGAWELGDAIQILPTSTLPYDIHFLNVGSTSADNTYQVVFYRADTLATTTEKRFTRGAGNNTAAADLVMMQTQPANTSQVAKCASNSGGGDSFVMSVNYHTY